jgi:S-DNA-T family DNA segregation ATPase FtsK/SpoIIIE
VDQDEIYDEAVCLVIETKQASASFLQRRMRIGYNRASRLIDAMEANGVISGARGSKPREILLDSFEPSDEEKYEEKKEEKEEKYAYEY